MNDHEFAILCAIYRTPAHGYKIFKTVNKNLTQIRVGSTYNILKRMEKDGLVQKIAQDYRDGVDLRIDAMYMATDHGRKVCEQYLNRLFIFHRNARRMIEDV